MAERRIRREKDLERGTVTFTELATSRTFTVSLEELPDSVKPAMLLHSLNTKVGDSAAGNATDPIEAMERTWESLKAGEFNMKFSNGNAGRITILAQALEQSTDHDMEAVLKLLKDMPDAKKKELTKHSRIRPAIEAIKAKNAANRAKEAKKESHDSGEELVFG